MTLLEHFNAYVDAKSYKDSFNDVPIDTEQEADMERADESWRDAAGALAESLSVNASGTGYSGELHELLTSLRDIARGGKARVTT